MSNNNNNNNTKTEDFLLMFLFSLFNRWYLYIFIHFSLRYFIICHQYGTDNKWQHISKAFKDDTNVLNKCMCAYTGVWRVQMCVCDVCVQN